MANAPVTPVVAAHGNRDLFRNAENDPVPRGPIVTGALTWYTDEPAFRLAAGQELCVEDFEESTLPPNSVMGISDPLKSGVPHTSFPNGLEGCDDMAVQSNLSAGNPEKPNPRGAAGLAVLSVGFLGATSDGVVTSTFVDSHDVIFDRDEVFAVGGNTLSFVGDFSVEIRVYDVDNNSLGMKVYPADPGGSNFMGVISEGAAIGRVNMYSPDNGAEGLDNIALHADQEPGPSDVLIAASPAKRAWAKDVIRKIAGTGKVPGKIDLFDTAAGTPTPEQLQQYDAVLTFTDRPSQNADLLGDRLADYVDSGRGGVVQCTFSWHNDIPLAGRWRSGGYSPLTYGIQSQGVRLTDGDAPRSRSRRLRPRENVQRRPR